MILLPWFRKHARVQNVEWKLTRRGDRVVIDCRCNWCRDTLHWVCTSSDRAAWRIDTWAAMHQH